MKQVIQTGSFDYDEEICTAIGDSEEEVIEYVQRHSHVARDVIKRFVDLHWEPEMSREENMLALEDYVADMQDCSFI